MLDKTSVFCKRRFGRKVGAGLDVALKDRRARRWCRDATRLAGREWAYEKVPQKLFDGFQGDTMDELRRLLDASDGGSGPVPGDEDGAVWPY